MISRWRWVLALLPLLLVSGCVRLTMGVTIVSDDDVAVSMHVAIEKASIENLTGQPAGAQAVCQQMTDLPPGVRTEGYDRDGFIGCRIEGRGPIAQMNGPGLTVRREGGEYIFVLQTTDRFGDPEAGQAPTAAFDQMSVSATFPGPVTEHNGTSTVNGNTVTWTDPEDLFAADGLQARGRAGSGVRRWLPWLIAAVIALALIATGLVLLLRGRRERAPARYPDPGQEARPKTGSAPAESAPTLVFQPWEPDPSLPDSYGAPPEPYGAPQDPHRAPPQLHPVPPDPQRWPHHDTGDRWEVWNQTSHWHDPPRHEPER